MCMYCTHGLPELGSVPFPMDLGCRLVEARTRMGLSQAELAGLLGRGHDRTGISKLEHGVLLPRLRTLALMACVLGVVPAVID